MTCEIAVMNKGGLALAADSAVTVGAGEKIYHHAEKLFALASGAPLAVLIYGSAEIMGAPWELVINAYARELGNRRFDRLDEYAEDFFRFVEACGALFAPDVQRAYFRSLVAAYWKTELAEPLAHRLKAAGVSQTADALLRELIAALHQTWTTYPPLGELAGGFGDKVVAEYADILTTLEKENLRRSRIGCRIKAGPSRDSAPDADATVDSSSRPERHRLRRHGRSRAIPGAPELCRRLDRRQ